MKGTVHILVFFLMADKVLKRDIELPAKAFYIPQRTGKVGGDQNRSCHDVVFMEDSNVAFEIGIQVWEFVHRDIEYYGILDHGIFIIREFGTGQHHVVKGCIKFAPDCVGRFFPFPTGFGHKVSPSSESF